MTYRHLFTLMASACLLAFSVGCTATQSTLMGTALGAGTGAIIGYQSGEAAAGAIIGGAAGTLAGALVGEEIEHRQARESWAYEQGYRDGRAGQRTHSAPGVNRRVTREVHHYHYGPRSRSRVVHHYHYGY